jgi:hypothetical protein
MIEGRIGLVGVVALCAAMISGAAQAVLIGGVDFPQGAVSFADAVTSYDPVINSNQPSAPHRVPENALGVPDYAGVNSCGATCSFVSLGDGGSITLRFTDNALTGSGSNALDLWIFEVGPDVEDTFVEISKDGTAWSSVGKVGGATAGVDIDAFGFGLSDQFLFVRLRDDPLLDGQSGATVGADIDAVGAISTVQISVPEPGTLALLAGAFAGAAFLRRPRAV